MELAQANLEAFAGTLLELAREDSDLLVVTSDSRGSAKLAPFAKAVPGQIVEVGIAEQNLVGVAAGLAAAGKNVFAVSPACFLTARSLEQIKKRSLLLGPAGDGGGHQRRCEGKRPSVDHLRNFENSFLTHQRGQALLGYRINNRSTKYLR